MTDVMAFFGLATLPGVRDPGQHLADRVAIMRDGEIIASGRPDELGGRDLRPAEIGFRLPARWSLGDLPELAGGERSLDGDSVLVLTQEPVVVTQRITTRAIDHDVDLKHFSVTQPRSRTSISS